MITVWLLWAAVLPPALAAGAWLLARFDKTHAIGLPADRLILAVWLGLITLSLALLPVAWWRPLTPTVYAAVGGLFIVLGFRDLKTLLEQVWTHLSIPARWPTAIVALLASLAVAIYATRPVTIYDTGLYHFPLIHWLSDAGLQRGLALLHGRFGFPALWFTIPAAFNHGLLRGRVAGLMGGLTMLTLVTHWLLVVHRTVRGQARAADRFAVWALAALLVFVADKAWLISASPDAPLAVLPVVLAWLWMLPERSSPALAVGLLLALGAACLKPSVAPMFAVALLACVSSAEVRRRPHLVAGLGVCVALAAGIILIASLVSSGCVYYPVGATCLHWPWSVSAATAAEEARRVVDWARWAGTTPDAAHSWLAVWMRAHDLELALGALSGLVLIGRVKWWRTVPGAALALIMALVSIAFGMVVAPDPRFWAGALFTLVGLAIWSCTRTGTATMRETSGAEASAWSPTMLIVSASLLLVAVAGRDHKRASAERVGTASMWTLPAVLPTPWSDQASRTQTLVEERTASGVSYLHPQAGDQCWDAPLPCAPHRLLNDLQYRDAQRGAVGGFERAR